MNALARTTCPILIAGVHFPVSVYWALVANAATYALVGLIVEALRQKLHPCFLPLIKAIGWD